MEGLTQDIRYALRTLSRSPAFLTITVLTLALGIGANVAIFTLVNAVLLQPLPFREPDRLVRVFDDLKGAGAKNVGMSVPELADLRERSGVFDEISAIWPVSTALTGGDRADRIEMLGTSPSYFELLGAKAALGTVYKQADWVPGFLDGVVISDGLWKRQFGGDPRVIGRRVRVDEDGYTIIGVMPPEFRHPGETLGGDVEIWAAAGFIAPPAPTPPIRNLRLFPAAMGRLKPGLTLQQAQQRLNAMVTQLQQAYPKDYPEHLLWSLRIEPAQTSLTGNVRPTLVFLLAAVGFVLLIVCVNVASLLLARSSARVREFAIRHALGAPRGRLVRQVLTESVLISLAGGATSLVVLRFALTSLLAMIPADVPRLAEVHSDWRILFLAIVLSVITGVVFGLTPALHASAIDPNRDLKEGGRTAGGQSVRQNRSRAALVVLEVALSVVLLVGAGLLIRSFSTMLRQEPGLDPKGLTAGQIWIPVPNDPKANRYLNAPQRAALVRELLRQLAELAGVQKAAIGTARDVPFLNANNPFPFSFLDESTIHQSEHAAEFGAVSPEYFEVLKAPLKAGRFFTNHDAEQGKRVVVVNEAFVRKFSPQRDAVGRRLSVGAGAESEIIGVVGDVRNEGLDVPAQPRVYASIFQSPGISLAMFLRTRSDAGSFKEILSQTVHGIDPELPVFGVRTMEELMSASMARRRFSLFLMSAFAALALLLAAMGIYGVMAFVVSQRVQEFGIRAALGAQPRDLLMLAFRPGLVLTAAGTVIGLAASIVVTRLMSSLLFGVAANDPITFATVPVVLAIVALAACFIPARRATRVSPVEALRS
jgi:putative ABC transport system permease protein